MSIWNKLLITYVTLKSFTIVNNTCIFDVIICNNDSVPVLMEVGIIDSMSSTNAQRTILNAHKNVAALEFKSGTSIYQIFTIGPHRRCFLVPVFTIVTVARDNCSTPCRVRLAMNKNLFVGTSNILRFNKRVPVCRTTDMIIRRLTLMFFRFYRTTDQLQWSARL